jgi:hypothetical protein
MSEETGPHVVPALTELIALPTPLNSGERWTIDALSRLDASWTVFVQPRLAAAQPDFVAVHPNKGVWVLEVKDWNPKIYRPVNNAGGRWVEVWDGERWVTRASPRNQINAYAKTFRERISDDPSTSPLVGNAVKVLIVLSQFTREQAIDLLGNFPIIASEELSEISHRLASEPDQDLDKEDMANLCRWLDEPEFVGDQRLPLTLSTRAREVTNNPKSIKNRRVRGPAGSGKSLALASRAIALAQEGKEVLVVSYNITLFHYLSDLCSRGSREQKVRHWKQFVSFTHFSGLLKDLFEQRPETWDPEIEWNQAVIQVLSEAYKSYGNDLPTYDAILVDEGQDFEGEWWAFLRQHVLRPGGEILLVADRTQNLYERPNWTESGTVGGGFKGPWFELDGTYRLPVDLVPIVCDFAKTFLSEEDLNLPSIKQDHPTLGDAHSPTHRTWLNVADVDVVDATADEVERLIREVRGLSPSDIVLLADHDAGFQIALELSNRGNDVVSLFTEHKGEKRQSLKRAFWAGRPGIKCCTVHSFKGWETRVAVCVPKVYGDMELYVALTRIKAAPDRSAYVSVVNGVDKFRSFKSRFEREILPSEVPELGGQGTLDV